MPKTRSQLLEEARSVVPEITPQEARDRLSRGGATMVDVRDDDEWRQGHVPGAAHVTRGMLEFGIEDVVPSPDSEVILYCAAGSRSLLAGQTLRSLGYGKVFSMTGGIRAWREAGLPVERERELTPEQLERYSRHIVLPRVGKAGQARLLDARVLIVGAGGLGCPTALYLAAAGVGTLGLVDGDTVDASNLQRQILHGTADVGRPKVESAIDALSRLNPDVRLVGHGVRLDQDNAWEIVSAYDVLVQCTDNFGARYLLNDVAHFARKPVVDASIFQFQGQATVLDTASGGPCYRCVFPEPPDPAAAPP